MTSTGRTARPTTQPVTGSSGPTVAPSGVPPAGQPAACPTRQPAGRLVSPPAVLPAEHPTGRRLDRLTLSGTWRRVRSALARARSLWRDLTGESAYERYLARYSREHAQCSSGTGSDHEAGRKAEHEVGHEVGHGPMSEREFWRARARQAEAEISTGCC